MSTSVDKTPRDKRKWIEELAEEIAVIADGPNAGWGVWADLIRAYAPRQDVVVSNRMIERAQREWTGLTKPIDEIPPLFVERIRGILTAALTEDTP